MFFGVCFLMANLEIASVNSVSADEKHVLYFVRLIVERQQIDNVWQSHRWVIHDLMPLDRVAGNGTPPINDIPLIPLRAGDDGLSMLFTADASLDLHHAESPKPMLKIWHHLIPQFIWCCARTITVMITQMLKLTKTLLMCT